LQESYRNALAISIFLSAALDHKGAAGFVLLGVIRSVDIPVPLDFSIRDDRKMVQNCIDTATSMLDTHEKATDLILPPLRGSWLVVSR
jgi:hypothetical protein